MDINEVWKTAMKQIQDKVSAISFDLWIKPLEVDSFNNGEFTLVAQSSGGKQMALNERHFPHIEFEIKELFEPVDVLFRLAVKHHRVKKFNGRIIA